MKINKVYLVTGFFRVYGAFVAIFFQLMAAKMLGPEEMGIFLAGLMVATVLATASRLGMDSAILRYISIEYGKSNFPIVRSIYTKTMSVLSISLLIICLVLFTVSKKIFTIFDMPVLHEYNYLIFTIIALSSLSIIHIPILQAINKVSNSSLIQNGIPMTFAILLMFLIPFHTAFELYIYIIIGWSGALIYSWANFDVPKISHQSSNYSFEKIIHSSIPLFFVTLFSQLLLWLPTFFGSIFLEHKEIGLLGVALRISTAASFLVIVINSILAPKVAYFYDKGDLVSIRKITRQAIKFIFLFSIGLVFFIYLFIDELLNFLGNDYAMAKPFLFIMLPGQVINGILGISAILLTMTGHEKVYKNAMFVTLGVSVITYYILAASNGASGISLSYTLSLLLLNLSIMIYVKIKLGFWILNFNPKNLIQGK